MAVTGAIFKALTFNGESSRDYGVYITGQAVYNAPKRDVEMITIPGRNGSFPLDHGRYENIEVTYPAGVYADNEQDFAEAVSDFRNMLCSANGYCRLEDEYNPDEYRMAIYKSGLEVEPALLKAGEFEITFECQPQRFLKSGEDAVAVVDGGTLANPTRLTAYPELQVKGYGTIEINGHKITLNNEPFGNVTILENVTNSSGVFELDSDSYAVNGNTFTVSVSTVTLFECIVAPITEVRRVSWNAGLEPTFTQTGESLFQLKQEVTKTLTKGTNNNESWSGSYQIFYGTPPTSHTVQASIHINYSATNDTITVYVTWSTGTPDTVREIDTVPTIKSAAFSNSTKSALGNPTIINCGDGEAYKIGLDGAISLDRYVDIGVELPSLKTGNNVFVVPNTVTELKVLPRWWKL